MTSVPSTNLTLAVFGGSGRTGRHILEQALERGWNVRVLARSPAKVEIRDRRLEIIEGDILDAGSVAEAIAGADAVVSVVGRTKDTKGPMMGPAARNIIAGMQRAGVRRLVATTGAGVRAPNDEPKFIDKAIVGLLKVIARDALDDGYDYAETIRGSNLDWTLVRAPRLNDGPSAGDQLYVGPVSSCSGTKLAREDFARYIVDQVQSSKHVRAMRMVSAA